MLQMRVLILITSRVILKKKTSQVRVGLQQVRVRVIYINYLTKKRSIFFHHSLPRSDSHYTDFGVFPILVL